MTVVVGAFKVIDSFRGSRLDVRVSIIPRLSVANVGGGYPANLVTRRFCIHWLSPNANLIISYRSRILSV